MKIYKNPTIAFLYEAAVGALSIFMISLWGGSGLWSLAFIFLRPFIFPTRKYKKDAGLWKFYYNTGKLAIILTAITVIFIYLTSDLILEANLFSHLQSKIGLILVPPYFLFIHGIISLFVWEKVKKNFLN